MAAALLWILLLTPVLGGAACLACRSARAVLVTVQAVVVLTAAVAAAAVWAVHGGGAVSAAREWLRLDALSSFHLVVMMAVFTLSSLYLPGHFDREIREGALTPGTARRFGLLWLGALAAMTIVLISGNVGIMWAGIEATTLVTAFLICIRPTPESLEAMWKYLIICSVGVAFAFMGTLLAGAAAAGPHLPASKALLWTSLRREAAHLNPVLIKAAFLFLLVGYGTKAGLAPMHSWLPDAHSQAPAPVSALFSGFMLNAALYCIMRYIPLVEEACGHTGWSLRLLLFFGLASVLAAAAFILFQHDLKRLLAYCSVEHIGIIAIGLGLGGPGTVAALLHTLNHSLCKSLAFFAAGRLDQMYGTHDMTKMAGTLRTAPIWGRGLLGSLLALMGVAPFALFVSEFLILRAAARSGSYATMGLFLAGVAVVFVGMFKHTINLAWGESAITPKPEPPRAADKALVAFSLCALLALGLWIPDLLWQMLGDAAQIVEGTP